MDDLNQLFDAYRAALSDPEPSAGFTPGVWQKIDARRSPLRWLRRMTEAVVALSAVAAVLIGVFLIPSIQSSPVYQSSYIDVLDNEQDVIAYAAVVQEEPAADAPNR